MPRVRQFIRKLYPFARLGVVALAVTFAVGVLLYYAIYTFLINEAKVNVENILLSHRGVHLYIQRVMHPSYYRARESGLITPEFYDPEMLSSSYMVRTMHAFMNEDRVGRGLSPIYYKMASTNPRNPVNRADPFEAELIAMFNNDRGVTEFEKVVNVGGKRFLYYAIPFLETNPACLRCHGRRGDAPPDLQRLYPGEGGFNEKAGVFRAIESIRIPLDQELYSAFILTGSLTAGVLAMVVLAFFNRRLRSAVRKQTVDLEREVRDRTRAEKDLKEHNERLETLVALGRMQHVPMRALAEHALSECVRMTRSPLGYLYLYDERTKEIGLFIWSEGAMKECKVGEQASHYPLEKAGIWADAVRLRQPVIQNDYATAPGRRGLPEGHVRVVRHMSVPVFDSGEIVAVVGVGNKPKPYEDTDINQMRLFMSSMWALIERNRAEGRLRDSLKEKEVLLSEIHHRVKNNLAVISSLLALQAKYIEDPAFLAVLKESRGRIMSMALVHEKLYEHRDFTSIDVGEYATALVENIRAAFSGEIGVSITVRATPGMRFDIDTLIPCGLILNELLTNALKHAFPEHPAPSVVISLSMPDESTASLEVSDNGRGLPEGVPGETRGLGLQIVNALVLQLGGALAVSSGPDGVGARFLVTFPPRLEFAGREY